MRRRSPVMQNADMPDFETRLIAFYFPQFPPIPENDAGRGKGVTGWRDTVRAEREAGSH